MSINEILILLLGWFLGILSPGIVSRIANHNKKEALRRIVITELKDIKKRLANIPFLIYPEYGKLDERTFNWVKKQTNNFKNISSDIEMSDDIREKFGQLDNPEFIKNFVLVCNTKKQKSNPAFGFKKFSISLIDSHIVNISLLDDEFIGKILDIKFNINILNEEIQNTSEYLKMTFDSSLTEENHQIISTQIRKNNLFIAERAIDKLPNNLTFHRNR